MFRYVQGRKFGITAGGGVSLFRPTKRAWPESCPTPKSLASGGGVEARRKKFSDIPFFTNFRTNVP